MSAQILIADDNFELRLFYTEILKGISADIAGGGFELLDRAMQHPYALIISDLAMPDLSGAEALKLLRGSAGPNQFAMALALTGDLSTEARQDMRRAGFDGYLEKPVRPAVLSQLCRWAADSREAGQLAAVGCAPVRTC